MEVRIDSLLQGAQEARGTVVIVDVFRAFTTAAVAFSNGAEKIVLVAEVDEALQLRENGVGEVCIGEVNGIRPDGFDMGQLPIRDAGCRSCRKDPDSIHTGGNPSA